MACNSVAVSSANVSVLMSSEEMQTVLRNAAGSMLGRMDNNLLYASFYADKLPEGKHTYAAAWLSNGDRLVMVQTVKDRRVTHQFFLDNGSQSARSDGNARLAAKLGELRPQIDKALAVGNQTAVLKRLAQLGKLSGVQQKDAGVVATITISA